MFLNILYDKLIKKDTGLFIVTIVWGFLIGVIWGLIWEITKGLTGELLTGLIWELIWGLVWGLFAGLFTGLIWGLTGGLAVGVIWGLTWELGFLLVNFSETLLFINTVPKILMLIFCIFVITECFFLLTKEKKLKKKTNVFWHTAKQTIIALVETLLICSGITQIYVLFREISFIEYLPNIIQWIGYIGVGIIIISLIIGILYILIKLNTRKYKKDDNIKE